MVEENKANIRARTNKTLRKDPIHQDLNKLDFVLILMNHVSNLTPKVFLIKEKKTV